MRNLVSISSAAALVLVSLVAHAEDVTYNVISPVPYAEGSGAFGGFKGTCSILGRCIEALGKDIATWLKDPEMDSQLGDA